MPPTSRPIGVQTRRANHTGRNQWMSNENSGPTVRPGKSITAHAATGTSSATSVPSKAKTSGQPRRPRSTSAKTSAAGTSNGEKRLRKLRKQPPQAFQDIFFRAATQRFYVLSRRRIVDGSAPAEIVELTGSTGNIYQVQVARQPSCNCPHAKQGNQCKHVVFVS